MCIKLYKSRIFIIAITSIVAIYFVLYSYSTMEPEMEQNVQINKSHSRDTTSIPQPIIQEPIQEYVSHNEPIASPLITVTDSPTKSPSQPPTKSPSESPTNSPIELNTKKHGQYIDLNVYSQYVNTTSDIIPSSWHELSQQQFCSIPSNATNLKQFMQFIYETQFGRDCNDSNHQFVVYDINLEAGSGLGASLLGNLKRYFAAALMLNRTFLLTGSYDWSYDRHYCQGNDAMECYFLPVSNCNAKDILQSVENDDNPHTYYKGGRPKHCIFGNNAEANKTLKPCTHRIMHIDHNDGHYVLLNGEIRKWIQQQFDIGMMAYEAMIPAFFLRPQPVVRDIIYDKIHKSIRKSMEGFQDHGLETMSTKHIIAYPIRASDKCNRINTITGKRYTHASESECFTPYEHVKVMNSIKYLTNDQIKTVIFTSEDSSFLDQVVKLMKDTNISQVSSWNIIRNTEDFSVGEGTTTYKKTVKVYNVSLDEGSGTTLERDHIVSALSSLVFQVHLEPEYIVYGDSSTWLKLMWKWLVFLNCNIEPGLHVMDNNKCIELSTPGYLHYYGQFPYKFARFSKRLWDRIRAEGLTPSRFEEKFGINITKFGWDKYCEQNFKTKDKFLR